MLSPSRFGRLVLVKVKEKISTSEGFGRVGKGLEKGESGGGKLRCWLALQVDWKVCNDVWRLK